MNNTKKQPKYTVLNQQFTDYIANLESKYKNTEQQQVNLVEQRRTIILLKLLDKLT